MKTRRFWIVVTAATFVSLGAMGVVVGAAQFKARPTNVAVIDLNKLFSSLQERNAIQADFKTREEKIGQEKSDREKELKSLKADLDLLNASSPDYRKKTEELQKKLFDLQAWWQWQGALMQSDSQLALTRLYNKITATAGKIAKENGYDLVLLKDAAEELGNVDPKVFSATIQSRKVLWSASDLDLTDQIATDMNNEYKNSVK